MGATLYPNHNKRILVILGIRAKLLIPTQFPLLLSGTPILSSVSALHPSDSSSPPWDSQPFLHCSPHLGKFSSEDARSSGRKGLLTLVLWTTQGQHRCAKEYLWAKWLVNGDTARTCKDFLPHPIRWCQVVQVHEKLSLFPALVKGYVTGRMNWPVMWAFIPGKFTNTAKQSCLLTLYWSPD